MKSPSAPSVVLLHSSGIMMWVANEVIVLFALLWLFLLLSLATFTLVPDFRPSILAPFLLFFGLFLLNEV
jgi:hypothetical protein